MAGGDPVASTIVPPRRQMLGGCRAQAKEKEPRKIDGGRTRELGPGEETPPTLAYIAGMTRLGSQVVSGGNSVHSASANTMVRKIGH
jgi:hypothetical protein